jgi:transposase
MFRKIITDDIWSKITPILKNFRIYFSYELRLFIEAVLWKLRTGAPWRDLPTEFGSHSTVFNKFNRWSNYGLWQEIFKQIQGEIDDEWNFIDSTIVKAHQHSTGYPSNESEQIGKSVAGNSTKIHMLSDAHGNPVNFILTEGQLHDSKIAGELINISSGENIIADRAYSSLEIRDQIIKKGAQAIIPKKKNSVNKTNIGFDNHLYKIRHLAENLFARLKHFRSIATRYEKKSNNFASMIYLGCAFIWGKI